MDQGALGLIETKGLVAAIEAADAAAKAASVRLLGIQKTNPALITVQVVGETAAVRSAIDAAKAAAERVGTVVSTHVIPRPAIDVAKMQSVAEPGSDPASAAGKAPAPDKNTGSPEPSAASAAARAPAKTAPKAKTAATPSRKPVTRASTLAAARVKPTGSLASMTVRELRALARSTEGLSIQGREIARASKAELLQALGR